ncbi:hypothetical protein MNBD_GAMMA05-1261 [hydrothermal vent metagenome]|uniref:Uncharacterized protein n=1 Tax=hydrothermal vent metagenome TaxID=652676 RepID=A0A3B0WRS4_9ZZZZ
MCGRSHKGLYNLCKLDVSGLSAITLILIELLGHLGRELKMDKDRVLK